MPADRKLVVNLTRASVLAEQVDIADTPLSRLRGLLGRGPLRPGEGVLLQPTPAIHSAFVHFRFDAVFLDFNLQVVRVAAGVRPWRVLAAHRAASVLELAAGEMERRGVQVGDQIIVSDLVAPTTVSARVERTSAPATGTRVLLIGPDRRYRSSTSILLQRRGYEVAESALVTGLAEEVGAHHADVVVLDAGSLPAVAALELARLDAANPLIGVVVVGERLGQPAPSIAMVAKWGPFDELLEAIDGARVAPAI